MRSLLIPKVEIGLAIGLLVLPALPALAAHRATINQLEQLLATATEKHRSDTDLARVLSDLQLSERLTPETLEHLASTYPLEPHSALALRLLSDESSVLDPPGAEIPAGPPPDDAAQKRMVDSARAYVMQSLPHLPDFFATRATLRFEDTPQVLHAGEWPVRAGFHLIGNASKTVTVRDGNEVTDSPQQVSEKPKEMTGLSSFGEFGPILARTLADIANARIQFSHWEQSSLGKAAVFRYSVPKHDSHYQVHFCCIEESEIQGRESFRNRNMPRYHTGNTNPVETNGLAAYDATPAYHGMLSIEPETGSVVRLTLEAELDPDNPIFRAATVVEYGRLVIGDQSFVCPVRSLAISSQQGPHLQVDAQRVPIISVNETTFTDYHRLGSSARLLAEGTTSQGMPLQKSADPEFGSATAEGATEPTADAVNGVEEQREIAVSAAMTPADTGLAVKVNIAAAGLGMQQEDGRWVGKLDIFLVQRGQGGIRDRVESLTLNLRLKPDTYKRMLSDGIPFQHTLEMQSGLTSMRVLVLDENTGRVGSVTLSASALQAARQAAAEPPHPEKP